jgi:hypothetical protein
MPNRRNLNLHKYQIDDDRYNELFYFCKRYQSRQAEINSLYGLTAISMDGMPKGNKVGSQTENKALKIDKLKRENELIEKIAYEVNPEIYQYIIKNVTQGISYQYLGVPCGRRQFYQYRRLFYKLLSEQR